MTSLINNKMLMKPIHKIYIYIKPIPYKFNKVIDKDNTYMQENT